VPIVDRPLRPPHIQWIVRVRRLYANIPRRLDGIIPSVASVVQIPTKGALKRIQRIQTLTIAWMSVEAALSLWAAWRARSPALAAFGGDSTIELLSAVVVVVLSHGCIRTRGTVCCAYRRRFAYSAGRICSIGFGDVSVRVQ
jgi:hypothetical protein